MQLELIGASLDDFSDYLFFADVNNRKIYYITFRSLGINVSGWGSISWKSEDKNTLYYKSQDHNLYISNLRFIYNNENDILNIFLQEERDGYDPIELKYAAENNDSTYFDSFEPGEIVTHFAQEKYNISEISKKVKIVSFDSFSDERREEKTRTLVLNWFKKYNINENTPECKMISSNGCAPATPESESPQDSFDLSDYLSNSIPINSITLNDQLNTLQASIEEYRTFANRSSNSELKAKFSEFADRRQALLDRIKNIFGT